MSFSSEKSKSSGNQSDQKPHPAFPAEPQPARNADLENDESLSQEDPPMTFRRVMVLVAMAFLWTASQIPLYFYGGIEPQVIDTVGGDAEATWIALGNLIPLAIITPFVGALSDIFGRKIIGIVSFILIIVGNIICAAAPSMNVFIVGSVLMGVGAGIGEMVALAVAGEIAPPRNRGYYVGGMIMTIVPFCPSVLYAQLIAYSSTWRWVGLLIGAWSLVGLVLTVVFYQPPPRRSDMTRRELAKQIDYVGGLLSAAGLTLFLVGLSLVSQGYGWTSAQILAPLIIGALLIIAFGIWEAKFVKYPMFPARLGQNPRVLTIILLITFVAGANFFAVLVFWPTQYQVIYAEPNAVSAGIGSLPVGFGIIFGSLIATGLVSILKGKIRLLMVVSAVVMTAGNGALACASLTNLSVVWVLISLACVGVGAVIVPNQVIGGIICPPDLIATTSALTISVRVLGGSIAYAIYYDIFSSKFTNLVPLYIEPILTKMHITDPTKIRGIADILRAGAFGELASHGFDHAEVAALTQAGKQTLVESYPVIYYTSIAFGGIAVIASLFLTGIEKDMKSNKRATTL